MCCPANFYQGFHNTFFVKALVNENSTDLTKEEGKRARVSSIFHL
jgi:hypothetical protein